AEERERLLAHVGGELGSEARKALGVRAEVGEASKIEPVADEAERLLDRSRIIEHAARVSFDPASLPEGAAKSRLEELLVRRAAPEDVAHARRELRSAHVPRASVAAPILDAIDEPGRREHRFERKADRLVEGAAFVGDGVGDRDQRLDLV